MSIAIPIDLTDDELMRVVPRLAGDERVATTRLIAHLAEVERRQLYVPAGYSSLYVYCRERLGHSEDAAHNRKVAAQVAVRYPAVLALMGDGRLSLTAVRMLAPLLRDDNWEDVFAAAAGKAKREIEVLLARLAPKPDVPSTVRKLPAAAPSPSPAAVPERPDASGPDAPAEQQPVKRAAAGKRPIVAPLSPQRYRVQFTVGEETEKKLRRLQELLRREIPGGDPAVIFDRAITLLLAKVENRKSGETARPRAGAKLGRGSRRVPASTRRVVAPRDGRQCAFVAKDGTRCTERAYLEYHHAGKPYAQGGGPGPENIALYCRAHNAYEGKRIFGVYLPPEVREARVAYDAMRFAVPERRT